VRTVIARYTDVAPEDLRFEADAFGRPRLASPRVDAIAFSLTHTAGLVACVVARDCACGIDAEAFDRRGDFALIASRVLSDSERRAWEALPERERREAFLRSWTLKEAYLKARGTGFHVSPRKVAFAADGDAIRLVAAPPDDPEPGAWRFVRLEPTERHTLAVALRPSGTPSPTVVVREGIPGIPTDAATGPRAARPGD